jgi:hypothetical protein
MAAGLGSFTDKPSGIGRTSARNEAKHAEKRDRISSAGRRGLSPTGETAKTTRLPPDSPRLAASKPGNVR